MVLTLLTGYGQICSRGGISCPELLTAYATVHLMFPDLCSWSFSLNSNVSDLTLSDFRVHTSFQKNTDHIIDMLGLQKLNC